MADAGPASGDRGVERQISAGRQLRLTLSGDNIVELVVETCPACEFPDDLFLEDEGDDGDAEDAGRFLGVRGGVMAQVCFKEHLNHSTESQQSLFLLTAINGEF
jgi:hypothetical protein